MRTKATTNEQARTIRGGITAEERWWLRACVRAAALLFMGLIAVGAASAAIHRVPEQFPTIRDAMSSSQHGDTILVGPGTYREQVKFFGLEVTLASTGGPDVTVIDANGHDAAIVIQRGQTPATTIDGFTITTQGTGRGILLNGASPRIPNNVIRDNHAASGANASAPRRNRSAAASDPAGWACKSLIASTRSFDLEDFLLEWPEEFARICLSPSLVAPMTTKVH